jgi:hypothetical protein
MPFKKNEQTNEKIQTVQLLKKWAPAWDDVLIDYRTRTLKVFHLCF